MKRENKYCFLTLGLTFMMLMMVFLSCDRTEDEFCFSDEVRLKASLSSVLSSVYTKGEGEIKSTYSGTLNIGLAKVIGEGNFDNAEGEALRARMGAPSSENLGLRDVEFYEFQGFPNAVDSVHYVAWYPYDEDVIYANSESDGNTTVTFAIPDDAYTDILYSDVASGTRLSGFNTLTFRHALVKYSIKVYAMEVGENGELINDVWGKIKAVELEQMPSECILSLPESSGSLPEVSYSGANKPLSRASVLDKLPLGFSKAADLTYFLAPPPSDNILRLNITTEKDGVEVVTKQTLSVARDFQPGKHYQIYLRFTTHGVISAEILAAKWEDGQSLDIDKDSGVYYNLSETQTANSYIVSSAYNYCFDATVRGNGYTGVVAIPGAPADIYKVGNPVKAEIVWTDLVDGTGENLDGIFKLSPTVVDGKVFFSVIPGSEDNYALQKEGNALVGVSDADGNMLWTWHIWLTDRPLEQGYKNGFSVLDRDMGATAYNPQDGSGTIAGVYYQWGRPTPLPLDKTVYRPVYDGFGKWSENEVVSLGSYDSETLKSIAERVAMPTTYFNQKATASEGTLTKSLWGWRTETDEYAKTIYDPCPPGYRMPSKRLWRDLVILDENNDGKHDAHVVTGHDGVKAAEFKVDVNHVEVFYPMTGYYADRLTHKDDEKGAYMWAATFELGELNNLDDDLPYGLDFVLASGSETELEEMQTVTELSYHAMPVRCISRMSKAHVTDLSDYQTANSYIVSDDGYYKFKATVRGNGVGQLVSPGSTSTIVLTEQLQTVDIKSQLVKVEPLWWHTYAAAPSREELDAGKHFTILNDGKPDADGYVSFMVESFFEGNLILAGRDAKNEIIWSWHIWFTDDPKMMKSNSFVVMDRNLGATHAPVNPEEPTGTALSETYGFYYQWGRKDPFVAPGASVYKYDEIDRTYVQKPDAFIAESDAMKRTVIHSVQNPMHYHLAPNDDTGVFSTSGIIDDFNITTSNNEVDKQCFSNMMHPDDRQSLWGYSASAGYGVTTTKTMYDPCPPGYIVAHYLVWTNTERDSNSNLYYSNLDGGFRYHGVTGTKNAGIFLTNHSGLFDPAWFPYSGYIVGDSFKLSKQGNMGMFHTSTPAGNGARSLMYDYNRSGQGVSGNYWGMPSTFGYPVRCQKE